MRADGDAANSADALSRLRAGRRVVIVNMTGDWCVTCKANERTMILLQKMYAQRGLDLWDIKIEWGKDAETGELLLIDEVSAGCCRAFDLKTGERINGMALAQRFKQ